MSASSQNQTSFQEALAQDRAAGISDKLHIRGIRSTVGMILSHSPERRVQ
jgi:hypothetical protein